MLLLMNHEGAGTKKSMEMRCLSVFQCLFSNSTLQSEANNLSRFRSISMAIVDINHCKTKWFSLLRSMIDWKNSNYFLNQ